MDPHSSLGSGRLLYEDFIKLKDCTIGQDSYKKWERKDVRCDIKLPRKERKSTKLVLKQTSRNITSPPKSHIPQSDTPIQLSGEDTPIGLIQKACSSRCRHGPKTSLPQIQRRQKKQFNYIDRHLLKIQVKAKRKAIDQYKSICESFYFNILRKDQNLALKNAICDVEGSTLSKVNGYLETYTRCKKLSTCIETDHGQDIESSSAAYKSSKDETDKEINAMVIKVNQTTKQVEIAQQSLELLLNYKDEIYPKEEIHIKELEEFVKKKRQVYADEISSLLDIANIETKKYEDAAKLSKHVSLLQISQATVDSIDNEILDLAVENRRIEESIEKLLFEEKQLEADIKDLEDNINSNDCVLPIKSIFPDVVINRPECQPSDNVSLRGIPLLKVYPV